jgi:hypothetical protein
MRSLSRRTVIMATASSAAVLGSAGAAGLAAQMPHAPSQQRPRVDHYTTAPGGELVASIVLAHNPYRFTTLYSLKLPDLRRGDVVQAHCQFEVTNDLGFDVMLAHAMLIHRKETVVVHRDQPEGRLLCEYAGENITPNMHHGFRTLMGSLSLEDDGDGWVSVLIYAASSAAKPGNTLSVEKNYGGLRAIVFRNVA